MSGPKGVSYRVVPESELRETALRNWRHTASSAGYFFTRARALGHSDLAFASGTEPAGTSNEVNQANTRLHQRLESAQQQLEARLMNERNQRIEHDLQQLLRELAEEEAEAYRASPMRTEQSRTTTDSGHAARLVERRTRVADQVSRRLSRLVASSPELEGMARIILESDVARAPMLLDDLDSRISTFNRETEQVHRDREHLNRLRSECELLPATPAVEALLERAAKELEAGRAVSGVLDTASRLIASLLERHQAERNRKFVLESVTASLEGLGYTVSAVDVVAPYTVVLQRAGNVGHGIQARVTDDEIDLRSVAFGDSDARADQTADEALCSDLEPLLNALRAEGIESGRIRRTPAGLVSPQRVRKTNSADSGTENRRRRARLSEQSKEGGR